MSASRPSARAGASGAGGSGAGTSGAGAFGAGDLFGVLLLFAGAALCAVSFSVLPWYSVAGVADSAGQGLLFSDLHANADQLAAPVAAAYFDRFAWGLVGVAVVLGVVARAVAGAGTVAAGLSTAVRAVAFLVSFAGAVLTYYALAQLFNAQRVAGGSAHGVLHSGSSGLYLALVGYLVTAAGALVGHRRRAPGPL